MYKYVRAEVLTITPQKRSIMISILDRMVGCGIKWRFDRALQRVSSRKRDDDDIKSIKSNVVPTVLNSIELEVLELEIITGREVGE